MWQQFFYVKPCGKGGIRWPTNILCRVFPLVFKSIFKVSHLIIRLSLPFFGGLVKDSAVEGGMLKTPVNGFGTDLLRGKFGVPAGLGRRIRFFTGLSGGVFLGIRLAVVPPEAVFGDPSPC